MQQHELDALVAEAQRSLKVMTVSEMRDFIASRISRQSMGRAPAEQTVAAMEMACKQTEFTNPIKFGGSSYKGFEPTADAPKYLPPAEPKCSIDPEIKYQPYINVPYASINKEILDKLRPQTSAFNFDITTTRGDLLSVSCSSREARDVVVKSLLDGGWISTPETGVLDRDTIEEIIISNNTPAKIYAL